MSGEVTADALEALLSGYHPTNGMQLGRELVDRLDRHGNTIKAVAGYDATLSAPKSQYVRWEGAPLYTPEPDVIHEVMGHANCLACPEIAELHRMTGAAIGRLDDERARLLIADVFWFTVEFGVVRERWRAEGVRCRAAQLTRRIRVVRRPRRDPPDRHRRDGYDQLRHRPLSAGVVRG